MWVREEIHKSPLCMFAFILGWLIEVILYEKSSSWIDKKYVVLFIYFVEKFSNVWLCWCIICKNWLWKWEVKMVIWVGWKELWYVIRVIFLIFLILCNKINKIHSNLHIKHNFMTNWCINSTMPCMHTCASISYNLVIIVWDNRKKKLYVKKMHFDFWSVKPIGKRRSVE